LACSHSLHDEAPEAILSGKANDAGHIHRIFDERGGENQDEYVFLYVQPRILFLSSKIGLIPLLGRV
jgi:hypothetical protein